MPISRACCGVVPCRSNALNASFGPSRMSALIVLPVAVTLMFPFMLAFALSLGMSAMVAVVVVIIVPAVFCTPMSISAACQLPPVSSIPFTHEETHNESYRRDCIVLGIASREYAQPPGRYGDCHAAVLPSSSSLLLSADAVTITSALLLPGNASPLLRLFRPGILPRLFLQPCDPCMRMVRHFTELQQIPHPETLAGFPFLAVFVVLREGDIIEGSAALGDVFPNRALYVAVADVIQRLDFIGIVSGLNLLS